mgnify:CR=1 FL=1
MTTEEKITRVQALLNNNENATDELISVFLDDAKAEILNVRYPFGIPETVSDVPAQYEYSQCKLAVRYFNRMGDEGEQIHNEDGVHRHYGSVDDIDILEKVVPIAKVI